uniref:Uncharacterized protein n=1 Tax=Anopheles epiroticus TaxID=199890 RepID=A0A182P678_9DIPT
MMRLAHLLLLFVALSAFAAAGPTVRKDETANDIPVPAEAEGEVKPPASEEPAVPVAAPVKAPVSNDEGATDGPTSSTDSEIKPAESDSTTSLVTTVAPTTSEPSTTPTPATTKAPSTTTVGSSGTTYVTFTKPPRKTITFDQRQEGKYNIRADLENFVIVVVPSGTSSGASLLDLLTRSAHKKDAHQSRKAVHKHRKNNKAHSAAHKKIAQVTPEVIVLDESNQRSGQLETEEFIEGRTPYKVDLSSSARSVDGADPTEETQGTPGKPSFTFSVEPVSAASSSRLVRFPSGNYPPPHTAAHRSHAAEGRALRIGGSDPNTNTLAAGSSSSRSSTSATNNHILPGDGDNLPHDGTNSLLLLRRSHDAGPAAEPRVDGDAGDNGLHVHAADATVRQPTALVDQHHHSYHAPSSFDSLEYVPLRSDVDMTQLQLEPDSEYRYDDLVPTGDDADEGLAGDWDELRLLGAQEQCGPDRKRDSYGVCQFVQP